MNHGSKDHFGVPEGPSLQADGHLSSEWLLLAIDGELSVADREFVEGHVLACWACRLRKTQLERTIEEVVEYEQALVAPHMPPSSRGRTAFLAKLDILAAEMGRPSLARRFAASLARPFRLALFPGTSWGLAAALTVAAVLFVVQQRSPIIVSAGELLQRATASDGRIPRGVSQPVVVQKLSIQVNHNKMTRIVYRDRARHRQAGRADVSANEECAAERAFRRSSFSWDDPLSPQVYGLWRGKIADKREAVTRVDGNLLRLDTTASSGPVARASLTVRASDYHPVEMDFLLRDQSEVEIAEVSYDVVGFASLNPQIFGIAVEPPVLNLPATGAANGLADDATSAVTELQVRTVLHGLGADLGEQIDVLPQKNGSVRVEGLTADDDRKERLMAALETIPHIRLHIETVAQAAAHQPVSRGSGTSHVAILSGATPLLDASLRRRFPDDDQRTAYVNQTLALTQGASARAWALNRLAERYSPQQIALLDNVSRQRLGTLLGDHLSTLREDINRLQNQLGQVLSTASNTAAANTASSKSGITEPADDWRSRAHRVHSSVQTVDESVAALLTGSLAGEKDDTETIEIGLRTTLTQLQAELQVMDQQVRKQF
jgi:hypothetical protein